jgi:hypothetical protein
MADDLTPGPVQVPVTVGMRIFVITDDHGNGPLEDNALVVSDVAIASSIWQRAGVRLVLESVRPWVAPGLLEVTGSETDTVRAHDWDPGQAHVDVYYIASTDKGAGNTPFPWADGPHAIILTAQEEKKDPDDWRGIALAHEFGHYLGLLHTHADDPSDDATYTDHCGDTDIADPHNVMTQGQRGRSTNPSVIHLTADQIALARGYLFGRWPNLVADTVAAVTA